MNAGLGRRTARMLMAVALIGASIAMAAPASAAPPIDVDFTVAETIPLGSPGTLLAPGLPFCPTAQVATPDATRADHGGVTTFSGTKAFDCGRGNTFTLTFRASVMGCSTTDSGTWKIIDGTGVFLGAKGHGILVGTYTGGDGTACSNTGIDDRYTGKIKLT